VCGPFRDVAPTARPRSHEAAEPYRVSERYAKAFGSHKFGDRHLPTSRGGHAMADKPYDRLDGFIWYDGQFVPWGDATLHVCTHGLHYASSVFEGERAYGGEIFKCTEHSERLKKSAQVLDFEIPYSVAEI